MLPPLSEALAKGVGVSYTQWEAWLALYHGKVLLIAKAGDAAPRGPAYAPTDASRAAQQAHLARLRAVERYPGCTFTSPDNLAKRIAYTAILDLLAKAPASRKPNNLPFGSLGSLFKGRELFLEKLHTALTRTGAGTAAAVTGKALHGLGGVGKTRVAIEYALRHADDYSALLFLRAESPERLDAGLAALAGAGILDLPEKEARKDAMKISAALGWLENHPVWLMILDNVDDRTAAAAVEKLMPKLFGGRVLITGRMANFSPAVEMLPLDVLDIADATAFLLERTQGRRAGAPDDNSLARELAGKLGRLALGLEQAGAYIATRRIGIARYLKLWQENRAKVLHWFDKDLMAYDHDVGLAATWATSVEQLTAAGRRLLERLAFFAPEPAPESLLDVAAPGDGADFDAREALADLFAYSLASPVAAADGQANVPAFAVHRLVQDFTQRGLEEAQHKQVLEEALGWVDAGFVGSPQDVRSWATLDPLAPHALALAWRAAEAGIPEPTARLMNQLGSLFYAKSRYAEAERLYRRALAIDEATLGPDHPDVAIRLNNLANLLKTTNCLAEAEPLMRRALAITETSYGPDHPTVAIRLSTLAGLLHDTNRVAEAEPLYRRALAIDEASYGPDHPKVAIRLNNLALLLQATNRLAEAEPLIRRALAIDEASYGPDHPDVARVLNNLAQLLQATNRLAEAEPLMRRALAITDASYGPDHPSVATSLNNLALWLKATNRLGDAEPMYRRALAIDEASYGPDHPDVARDLNNLAQLLKDTNRLVETEPLMRRALAITEASYGPDHPNVATALNNLALLLQATSRLVEAEPLMRRHVEIFLSFTGGRAINTPICWRHWITTRPFLSRGAAVELRPAPPSKRSPARMG
jgi:tetratricopeptide (TPR) repeat protein